MITVLLTKLVLIWSTLTGLVLVTLHTPVHICTRACVIHINVLHPQNHRRPVALIFPLISMHTGIKILPLTSLPLWKYINKSCWISVNVPADRACAPLRPAEMPACCFLLSLAGGLLWLPTRDPQTLAVVREMDLPFWYAKFLYFFYLFIFFQIGLIGVIRGCLTLPATLFISR